MRVFEDHSPGSQPVQVRRPGLRIALQHACPVIEIIDGDEQDVRLCGLAVGGLCFTSRADHARKRNRQKQERCLFHCFHCVLIVLTGARF